MAEKDSNLKTSFVEIPKPLAYKRLRREGVLAFDEDNLYPQRTELYIEGSATGKAVYNLYRKHITGEGFRDKTLESLIVNDQEETLGEIHKKICRDKARHGGFALHLDMDVAGNIHQIRYIPFKWVRLGDPEHRIPRGRMAVYPDWEGLVWRSFKPEKVDWIFPFNPDPAVIAEQIENSGKDEKTVGTIEDWNGQLFYYTEADNGYGPSPFHPSLNDMETDQELALFRNSTVLSSFLATYAAIFKQKFEDPQESLEMDQNLLKVQGGRHAGKVIKIEGTGEDPDAVRFEKLETIEHDGLFEQTEESTQKNIRKSVLAPAELTGEDFSSGFDTNRIQEQRRYMNSITRDERDDVQYQLEKLLPFWHASTPLDAEVIQLYEDELEEVTQEDQEEKTETPNEDGQDN